MAEYSIGDLKALMDNDNRGFGDAGFLWIILIFLFFLAFSGDGLFGGGANGLEQTQRDILTTSCETQKGTLESQYNTLLGFKDQQLQLSECCCENRLAICQQTNALATAIHAEGEETRALINANTIQGLRDTLNGINLSLSNQVLASNIVNQIRPIPIPAYPTCSPYTSCGCGCGCAQSLI